MITEPIFLVNSAFGTYVPETFCERYKDEEYPFRFDDHDRAMELIEEILINGIEYVFYYEAYEELLSMDVTYNDQPCFLYHDEDLWLCPVGYNFEEQ